MKTEYDQVEGTWAHLLRANWLAFNEVVKDMNDSKGKLPHYKMRAYVLYDMQRRHDEEVNGVSTKGLI